MGTWQSPRGARLNSSAPITWRVRRFPNAHASSSSTEMNNGSPTVRLAFGGTHKVIKTGMGREHGFQELPALLVSYVYLDFFMKVRPELSFRDWVMDSGAFSAYNSGSEIKLQDYIKTCKQYLENDPQLTE